MARRIEVEIVGDSRSLERAFARSERSATSFNEKVRRQNRLTAESFKTLAVGMSAGIGASALLLGKQFVDASRNAEVILGQTSVAVKDAGLYWEGYAKTIEDASKRISTASAFDDEDVLRSFQVFVRGQKDVAKSLQLTELAADVARGRYTDLESATMLVNKAAMGQIGALRRAGIQIDKNATSAEALDALLKAYGGSAKTYADSAAGSSDKLRVAWENLAEQAGGPLSQALAVVAGELTTIVGLMEKAGTLKFPTVPGFGGGTLGGLTNKAGGLALIPGMAPIILTKQIIDRLRGAGGGGDFAGTGDTGGGGNFAVPTGAAQAGRKAAGVVSDIAAYINRWASVGKTQAALTNITDFVQKWLAVGKEAAAAQKKAAADAYQTRMETQGGWLDFGIERAEATKTIRDDLAAYRKKEAWLKERIRREGRTLELVSELWRTRQKIQDLNKKHADKDPLAGLMQVSTKQLTNILAAGTGLGAAGRGRLAYNIAGAEIQPTHVHVHIDGREVAHAVTVQQTRSGRRTATQTSGRRG